MITKKTEILAPVGSMQMLAAAVRCGANAVYLGGKELNARRNAANFTADELQSAVNYCHARGVNVYMTLNTLVGDGEMQTAVSAVERACRLGVDALIVQDIGLADVVRRVAPDMLLHASTQMSVQSADGVKMLSEMGFSRVVLPRELTREEIADIAANTDMELEVFVHGALCMCVSGQCLMSAVLGGRSGNRGLCAQPCRLPFGVNGGKGNVLSLRDLSMIQNLGELADLGVMSFKIEGRMKRPEYVAAAVTACRHSLCGEYDTKTENDLRRVFSRSGFTNGYYENKKGAAMFGVRTKEDVVGSADVLKDLARLYDNENPLIPVTMELSVSSDSPLSLTVSAQGKTVTVSGDCVPVAAQNKALDEGELKSRLSKCGGTQFFAEKVAVNLQPELYAPVSAFNELRRNALQMLEKEISRRKTVHFKTEKISIQKYTAAASPALHVRVKSASQLEKLPSGVSRVIVPLDTAGETVKKLVADGTEVAAEIPRAVFSNAVKYARRLAELKESGVTLAYAGTLDGVEIARKADLPCVAGFGMNIFNTPSLSQLEKLGVAETVLSCEMTLRQIGDLGGSIKRSVLVYGHLPLMLTRNCPVSTKLTCAECKGNSVITDRMGIDFPVVCANGCSEVLNSRPVWLADKLGAVSGADAFLLYFTNETAQAVADTVTAYKNKEKPSGEFTRGLYTKGVE